MTKEELMTKLDNSLFEWADYTHEGKEGLLVRCACPRCKNNEEKTHIAFDALPDLSWGAIKRHVINGRHVYHMTRIVGYFSKVSNWNKSKLGELEDRQAGDYSF